MANILDIDEIMTLEELSKSVNDKFMFYLPTSELLLEVKEFASCIASKHWPEVRGVEVAYSSVNHLLHLSPVFRSEQDFIWWSLKNR